MNRNAEKDRRFGAVDESLSIEVTTRCNVDCVHCFARARASGAETLSLEVAKQIVSEGYQNDYRHLHITGGEPFLWQGLNELLNFAFHLGYQTVFLNTNGTFLGKETCRRLAAYDKLLMSVSLEASESLHAHLRGKNHYQSVILGIQNSLDAGVDLRIFTTACKSMLPELPRFADDLFKNFSAIKHLALIQLIKVANDSDELTDELLDPAEFLQLIRTVSALNLLGHRTYFLNNPLSCAAAELLKTPWLPPSAPLYRHRSLIVLADGEMSLSHSSRKSFGQYEPGMITEVLSSKKYQKAVAPNNATCPVCKYSEVCKKNGMLQPSESYWDVKSEKFFCQRVLDRIEGQENATSCLRQAVK